jgi:3-oxoacyl-[acyl-carrier-protein] synthase II
MNKRRVVVTGMGVVTSLGETVDAMWAALLAGKSGIGPLTRWDMSPYPVRFGGECTAFDVTTYGVHKKDVKKLDRFAQFGIAASVSAVKDSRLDFNVENRVRCGVIIGSGIGGIETIEDAQTTCITRSFDRLSPFTVPKMMANAASGNVSIMFGLNGICTAVSTACATAANAIGDAARFIEGNHADVMIAGGAEAALCKLGMASFIAARALSQRNDDPTKASRPWDKNRDGFVMGEGAGVVVLEEYEHAKARGATIYAELAGYGTTADAHHITAPIEDGTGASMAMTLALADAAISPEQVQYVNAHGTSTHLGDMAEVRAIKRTFGEAIAKKLAISSTKSHLGHLLGASGGIEAIVSILATRDNVVPPTINLDEPDEGADLDFVPHVKREMAVQYAMSNSFGFGGHNASLLFKKA